MINYEAIKQLCQIMFQACGSVSIVASGDTRLSSNFSIFENL